MPADEADDLHITKQLCGPRDVKVSASCPAGLQRTGPWRVEDFDLHKRLYQGKASLLYSATCKKSKLPVAVKVYRKARLSELNWYQVEREIRIHSRLDHENIIRLYAAFEDDANVYMVQEYATGGDLYEDLKQRGGRFEQARTAAGVLRPCIAALIYLHSKGIIHRDIKPENILLMTDKSIKLADFGLSIDATSERPVTRAGTLDYMAPEVLLCPEKSRPQENKDKVLLGYTSMVDAWAMGILAYELIVGKPPFEKQSRAATYEHIMYRKPEFPPNMSPDAKDFVFTALTKAARKRPALANMLSHPWLRPPAQAAAPPPQALPQVPLTAAPTLGPSPLGLAHIDNGPQTPMPQEGRQHQGMSPCTTASEETMLSCDMLVTPAGHSDSRMAAGGLSLMPPAGVQGQGQGPMPVNPQRSFNESNRAKTPPSTSGLSGSSFKKSNESSDESQNQTTWTASLRRGMLKVLSKGSTGKDSKSTQDAAAAAVGTSPQKPSGTGQQSVDAPSLPNSPPGSRPAGAGGNMSVRGLNIRPKQASSFKGISQSLSSAMLSPIANQPPSQGSPDPSVKSGKSVSRSNSTVPSPFSSDAAQTRSMKPSLDLTTVLGQGKLNVALTTAASLPASGLKGNMQATKPSVSRMESYREANSDSIPHFQGQALGGTLAPQPSQPVQTVQQMLAAMQQEHHACESSAAGGKLSPRTMSLGMPAMGEFVAEGRARPVAPGGAVRDTWSLESPFADSLLSKSYANSISRRYAMAGAGQGSIGGSSSNFTDYAAAQKGPPDALRGATSYPIKANHRTAYVYMELYGGDGQESEAPVMQQSPPSDRNAQLMKRSQSLALPANMVLEAAGRSPSNRNPYKRADLVTRSQRQMSVQTSDDGGASAVLQSQLQQHHQLQQQKGDKGVPKRRITTQNIEPSKAAWLAQSAFRDVDSPRLGSGLIKGGQGGLGGFEEEGQHAC